MSKAIEIFCFVIYAVVMVYIFYLVVQRLRGQKKWELEKYVEELRKIPCLSCEGSGGIWTKDGELIDICEECESYGRLWAYCGFYLPRWIRRKYGRVVAESIYVEELPTQALIAKQKEKEE